VFSAVIPRFQVLVPSVFSTVIPRFQVLVPSAGIRGFLDASEYGTWMKHFQSVSDDSNQNVKHLLLAGQVSP
jgi:hypothetical protein